MMCRMVSGRAFYCLVAICWHFCEMELVASLSTFTSHGGDRISKKHRDGRKGSIANKSFQPETEVDDVFRIGTSDTTESVNSRRDFLAKKASGLATAVAAVAAATFVRCSPSYAADAAPSSSTTAAGGGVKISKRAGGLAQKIRGGVCFKMDELQRDLMQERWDLLTPYPAQLRSYVQLFTTYTDAAFPSDLPSDYGLRVALRYEVGRFFASVERLKRAIAKQALDEAYTAYADMSLHLDRYLRVGGLYTYYDSVIDNEQFFQEYNEALVYSDPVKDPPEVRDLVVLCKGPDKGKTGIVIGLFPDVTNNCVVKLDKYRGMREIRVVPRNWAAKRLGEQDPDDVFLIPRSGGSNHQKGSKA